MQSTQRVSPNAVAALREALATVFWAKRDLYDWLAVEVEDRRLLEGIDWFGSGTYKRQSVRIFVERLSGDPSAHHELMLRLMADIAAMEDFPQLAWLEDADQKIASAREAVGRVRQYIRPYEEQLTQEAKARERIAAQRDAAAKNKAMSAALERMRTEHLTLFGSTDAQRRDPPWVSWRLC